MENNDIVRIRNVGDEVWSDLFNNQRFVVGPGKEIVAPWAAAKLWLGDPYLKDKERRAERRDEMNRLMVRYGATGQPFEEWDEYRPKVQVFNFDNQQIPMLADSFSVTPQSAWTPEDQSSAIQDQINALTRQLQHLSSQRDSLGDEVPEDEAISEDIPSKVPTSRVVAE